jgi:hypothetical protein
MEPVGANSAMRLAMVGAPSARAVAERSGDSDHTGAVAALSSASASTGIILNAKVEFSGALGI